MRASVCGPPRLGMGGTPVRSRIRPRTPARSVRMRTHKSHVTCPKGHLLREALGAVEYVLGDVLELGGGQAGLGDVALEALFRHAGGDLVRAGVAGDEALHAPLAAVADELRGLPGAVGDLGAGPLR